MGVKVKVKVPASTHKRRPKRGGLEKEARQPQLPTQAMERNQIGDGLYEISRENGPNLQQLKQRRMIGRPDGTARLLRIQTPGL